MPPTTPRTRPATKTRHLGGLLRARRRRRPGLCLALLLAALPPTPLAAQDGGWRGPFAAGQEARAAEDWPAYARQMAAAAQAMEPGVLNRPFVQYHAARAHALLGEPDEAVGWLTLMWEEDIEALMASFARWDPAFDDMRDHPGFREVAARPSTMKLGTRRLAEGIRLVAGAGANVVASVGADGVLLVDTGYGPALPALRRALARDAGLEGGAGPGEPVVSILVLTHPHEDHWGAAAELGAEAVVLAHPATARAMDEPLVFMEGVEVPPRPAAARPDAVTRDTTFAFNGEEVRILPVEAHTGADLAVHFPRARVLVLGDAWLAGNPMMFPGAEEPDAFLDRLQAFVEDLPGETVVVGGHDEPTDPAAVLAQIAETRGCMALVREALAEGLDLEATVERAAGRYPAPWVAYFHRALGEDDGAGGP